METIKRTALIVVVLLISGTVGASAQEGAVKDYPKIIHWVIDTVVRVEGGAKFTGLGSDGRIRSVICPTVELKYRYGVPEADDLQGCDFDAPDFETGIKAILKDRQGITPKEIKANILVVALKKKGQNYTQEGPYGLCDTDFTLDNHLQPDLRAMTASYYSLRNRTTQATVSEASSCDQFGSLPTNCRYAKMVLIEKTVGEDETTEKRTPFLLRSDNKPTVQFISPTPANPPK